LSFLDLHQKNPHIFKTPDRKKTRIRGVCKPSQKSSNKRKKKMHRTRKMSPREFSAVKLGQKLGKQLNLSLKKESVTSPLTTSLYAELLAKQASLYNYEESLVTALKIGFETGYRSQNDDPSASNKPGRPPGDGDQNLMRVQARMSKEDIDAARAIGVGNVSLGIRTALRSCLLMSTNSHSV
jgi:hypothetical protein